MDTYQHSLRPSRRHSRESNSISRLCTALGALALIPLLLAACDSQSNTNRTSDPGGATPTLTTVGRPGATVAASPSAQPTTGAPGQVGFAAICSQSQSVNNQLPKNVPAYPGARLQVGQAQGSFGLYGLCSSDDVSMVTSFYTAQLPSNGWSQLKQSSLGTSTVQITAVQGNARLSVTITADAQVAGTTDIIIQTSGL